MDMILAMLVIFIVGVAIGMVIMYCMIDYQFYKDIEEKDGDLYDFAQYCRRKK